MSELKISIIMPAYNAEKTIGESIQSVLSNSSDQFELIVINDGSTDATESIIKSFNDSRIKYIKKSNSGVSDTRNYGLKKAEGEYITFIDSDDCYTDGAVDKLIEYTDKYSVDFLGFGFYKEYLKGDRVVQTNANTISHTLKFDLKDGADCFKYIYQSSHILFQTSWNKVLRRDIMLKNGIEFNKKLVCYENLTMVLDYLRYAKSAVFLSDILYKYNSRLDNQVRVLDKRRKLELTEDVSACYRMFIALCERFNYTEDYRNFMNQSFLENYIFCSRKYFEESDKYSKKERFDAFCRFLYDEDFIRLRNEYLGNTRFYKILYMFADRKMMHIAYKMYGKKLIKQH